MENPWLELRPTQNSYILQRDHECVRWHNQTVRDDAKKFVDWSIPEPFIGNPKTAKVILLGTNPGHSEDDKESHNDCDFRNAMFHNLRHESQEYPFYPLKPKFSWTVAGKWWRLRTRELREETGLDDKIIAERLMVIEWFPYHSVSFAEPKIARKSQHYSFHLAKEMLEQKRLIVGMRAKKLWEAADPRFGRVPFLVNPQSGYISRGNTAGDLFDEIVETLKRNHN